jgi:hypothetical protein
MDSYLAREGILVKNGAGLVLFYCSMLWARDLTVSGEIPTGNVRLIAHESLSILLEVFPHCLLHICLDFALNLL